MISRTQAYPRQSKPKWLLKPVIFYQPHDPSSAEALRIRSALVYERDESFIGLIRFSDLLKLVLPLFLGESPYTTYFTEVL